MFKFWKNYSESFKRSFLIIAMYGLAFAFGYIAQIIGNPKVNASFYISEQKKFAVYQIGLKDVLDLIFIGPIFTILSFFLIKRVLDDLKQCDFPENKVHFYYIIYLIAIVLFNYGNMIHITMNRLNAQIIENYSTEAVYYSVYFLDEIIGHLFLTIGFFIIFTEISYLHTLSLNKHHVQEDFSEFLLKPGEKKYNFIFGIGLGVFTAFTYLEGQCAFVFLILNPIFCTLLIIYNNKKANLKIKDNSLIITFIIMTIAFAATVLIWGFITGFKPYYPFFYQKSEL
ncbi:MAG: hypothetical protein ACTSQJ_19245 [Promethearchaeota archaeon]